jgi:fatty acid CoA ligase FadD9
MACDTDLGGEQARLRLARMIESDPQIAAAVPKPGVQARLARSDMIYREVIATVLDIYADRPALGSRTYEVRRDAEGRNRRRYAPSCETMTYADLRQEIEAFAGFWQHVPPFTIAPGEAIAFIAFNGRQITVADLACAYIQAVGVPLQANLPPESMAQVLGEISPVALVASVENLAVATAQALAQDSVRSLIVLDVDEGDDDDRTAMEAMRARIAQSGKPLAVATFDEVLERGRAAPWSSVGLPPRTRDDIAMILYTSGSTGTPKGAMIHDDMMIQFWADIPFPRPLISIVYGPMNHFVGRDMVFTALAQGGTAYFSLKSDMSTLMEDARIVRPTWIMFFPRLVEMVYQNYLSETQRRLAGGVDADSASRAVIEEMRTGYFGDRLVLGCTGSSATSAEARAFIRDCFRIALPEGYGSTEAGGCALTWDNVVQRPNVIDYKLRDVPELGYSTTDKPFPRGELLVRTRLQFKGYFKRPELSADLFDEDGYVVTGDIVEERAPDHLVWIDRRSNVLKLSQSEFVSIAALESAFLAGAPVVKQIYLYGNSLRSFLIAVVVPDVDLAATELGHPPSDQELRGLVLSHLQETARSAGLKSFEIPRDLIIERQAFTLDNGLLSSVGKPLRPKLKARYGNALEQLYEDIERKMHTELAELSDGADGGSTLDLLRAAIKANLGLESIGMIGGDQSYRDLGGDSLGAVGFAILIEEVFKVRVPAGFLLDPSAGTRRVAEFIDRARLGEEGISAFAKVHGAGSREIRADDLQASAFFDADALAASATVAAPASDRTMSVLITGATGFLGRFLCLEWLERLAPVGGKVICLVRGRDADNARRRLEAAFDQGDERLSARFRELASAHLDIVQGDISQPGLGLGEDMFARLAQGVDHILHAGAMVNHVLSYGDMFEANVVGTAELIRLAISGKRKQVDYISSVAVAHMVSGLMASSEGDDIRVAMPRMALSDDYANGYGLGKWACEALLRNAHDRYGFGVNVFRPSMILPHSVYRGQINHADTFIRLLYSIVATGISPSSFYAAAPSGEGRGPHYDGLPVDFVAKVVQRIGEERGTSFRTFNVINNNVQNPVSLDRIVGWVASEEQAIRVVPDHSRWFAQFTEAMDRLPADQRERSAINVAAYFGVPEPLHTAIPPHAGFSGQLREKLGLAITPPLDRDYVLKILDDLRAA